MMYYGKDVIDPFECFGSSSDDDDEVEVEKDGNQNDSTSSAPTLTTTPTSAKLQVEGDTAMTNKLEQINNHDAHDSSDPPPSQTLPPPIKLFLQQQERQPPFYISSNMQLSYIKTTCTSCTNCTTTACSNDFGIGRGYIATCDISPGTLLLVEQPLLDWNNVASDMAEQEDKTTKYKYNNKNEESKLLVGLNTIEYILRRNDAQSVVTWMNELHPTMTFMDQLLLVVNDQQSQAQVDVVNNGISSSSNSSSSCSCKSHTMERLLNLAFELKEYYTQSGELQTLVQLAKTNKIYRRHHSPPILSSSNHCNYNNNNEECLPTKTTTPNNTCRHRLFGNHHLDDFDIVRMVLVLRFNSFKSGLYLHYSMFNHDCHSNCIKFIPLSSSSSIPTSTCTNNINKHSEGNKMEQQEHCLVSYSEVRATKYIKRGESLTLYYLDPQEQCHASRRCHLMEQHLFDIGSAPYSAGEEAGQIDSTTTTSAAPSLLMEMEFVNGKVPISSPFTLDADFVTQRIEKTVLQLQDERLSLVSSLALPSPSSLNSSTEQQAECSRLGMVNECKRLQALELAAMELCREAIEQLGNEIHIVLIKCYRVHMDAAELFFLSDTNNNADIVGCGGSVGTLVASLKTTQAERNNVMYRFVQSAHRLLELQRILYGDYHPDLARTYNDIAQGIGSLLTSAPRKLLMMKGVSSGVSSTTYKVTFGDWSREEDRCRKEFHRIRSLYLKDGGH